MMRRAEPELVRAAGLDAMMSGTALRASGSDPAGGSARSIGEFIRAARRLSDVQIEQILMYQRQHQVRFGEAAIALNLASRDDVLKALSLQFHYPYGHARDVPVDPELVVATQPFEAQAEVFRDLRSQLLAGVLAPDQPRCALAVVSAQAGDGRSFVAANLAVSFSQLGLRTLLVDADLRLPRLHRLFGLQPRSGLSGVLAGLRETEVIHEVAGLPSLYVMPAGAVPPNPNELVAHASFSLLLRDLFERFDQIIVDTPAAGCGSDARVLAQKCGAAMVVGRRDRSAVKPMRTLIDSLSRTPTRLAGVLINEH